MLPSRTPAETSRTTPPLPRCGAETRLGVGHVSGTPSVLTRTVQPPYPSSGDTDLVSLLPLSPSSPTPLFFVYHVPDDPEVLLNPKLGLSLSFSSGSGVKVY